MVDHNKDFRTLMRYLFVVTIRAGFSRDILFRSRAIYNQMQQFITPESLVRLCQGQKRSNLINESNLPTDLHRRQFIRQCLYSDLVIGRPGNCQFSFGNSIWPYVFHLRLQGGDFPCIETASPPQYAMACMPRLTSRSAPRLYFQCFSGRR